MMKDYMIKFKEFLSESGRVLRVTKKPGKEEFKAIVKVSGIGILIIGFIGFVIFIIGDLLR
ncbi:MAG: protein translocase SEC61 complex subunit gamma [archaeon]